MRVRGGDSCLSFQRILVTFFLIRYSLAFILISLFFSHNISCWTSLHTIKFEEFVPSDKKNEIWQIQKFELPLFSQLIFSWNAYRPLIGYFSFWIQVRDSISKRWYNWHQMAQWGTTLSGKFIQRSLASKSSRGTQYTYVRLELPKRRLADAFRVKIQAHDGANIGNIDQVAVNTINNNKFFSEVRSQQLKKLPSIYISTVPRRSQMVLDHPDYDSLCSPTSTSMLLGYLLEQPIDPKDIAKGVYDHGLKVYGSWPFNVAHAFEKCKGTMTFHVERLASFKVLHKLLTDGIPVVVSIRGPLKGAPLAYKKGHLLLVVGYNKRLKKVLCHDPAFNSNLKTAVSYDLSQFLRAWERSQRLAYVAKYND